MCLLQILVLFFHSHIQKSEVLSIEVLSKVRRKHFSSPFHTKQLKPERTGKFCSPENSQHFQKSATKPKSWVKLLMLGNVRAPKSCEDVEMRESQGKCFKLHTEWSLLAVWRITLGNKLLCLMTAAIIKCQGWSLQELTTD